MKKILFNGLVAITVLFGNCIGVMGGELEEIEKRGKLIIAVKDNTRPLGFIDESGALVGLEIDIARRLAQEILGDPNAIILKPVSNEDRLKEVIDDRVDLGIARVGDTPSRRRIVDFSPYYYLDGTGIITKDITVNNVSSLQNSKIAVLYNSATIATIRYQIPEVSLVGVNSYQEALSLLSSGEVKAFAGDRSILAGWIQEYPEYKLLPQKLSGQPLSIVMPKGLQYKELRKKVNDAISLWKKSGWLQERIEYWGLP